MLVDDGGDGAVLDSRRHRLEAGRGEAPHYLLRHRRGCDVYFADGEAEQGIAHRPADGARLLAVAVEHAEQPRQRALLKPGGAFQTLRDSARRHLVVPGTNFPFSMCAGT